MSAHGVDYFRCNMTSLARLPLPKMCQAFNSNDWLSNRCFLGGVFYTNIYWILSDFLIDCICATDKNTIVFLLQWNVNHIDVNCLNFKFFLNKVTRTYLFLDNSNFPPRLNMSCENHHKLNSYHLKHHIPCTSGLSTVTRLQCLYLIFRGSNFWIISYNCRGLVHVCFCFGHKWPTKAAGSRGRREYMSGYWQAS